jgi:hypothetical protein
VIPVATSTIPPLFQGVGSFRPISQPPRRPAIEPPPTTPDALLCAVFTAEGAIENIHDLTSLELDSQALLHYEQTLLDCPPDVQLDALGQAFHQQIAIPTVYELTSRYLTAWRRLYVAVHAASPRLDPAI